MFTRSAFVSAGEGSADWVRRYQWRTSAAAPETWGAAWELPEWTVYQVVPGKSLQTPSPA